MLKNILESKHVSFRVLRDVVGQDEVTASEFAKSAYTAFERADAKARHAKNEQDQKRRIAIAAVVLNPTNRIIIKATGDTERDYISNDLIPVYNVIVPYLAATRVARSRLSYLLTNDLSFDLEQDKIKNRDLARLTLEEARTIAFFARKPLAELTVSAVPTRQEPPNPAAPVSEAKL